MSNSALLQAACAVLRDNQPGLDPEAMIVLLFLLANDGLTVGQIAGATGMTEPIAYRHVSTLQSAGLVRLVNTGTGSNEAHLSGDGQQLKAVVDGVLNGPV